MSGPYGGTPPPPLYAPPPAGIAPVGPPIMGPSGGWLYGRMLGPSVPELLGRVREGVRFYLIVLILQFFTALGGVAVSGFVLGGGALTAPVGGGGSGALAPVLALSILLGVLGLIAFVLTIVAWIKWRSGVRSLPDAAVALGGSYLESARAAARDYGRTVWAFIAGIVATVALSVGVTIYIIGQTIRNLPNCTVANGTCPPGAASPISNAELAAVIVAGGLVFELFTFLMYYFASKSLVSALAPLAPPSDQEQLHQGRFAVLLGAALLPLGLLTEIVAATGNQIPALGFAGLVSPALLLYGMYRLSDTYSRWCASHPPPPLATSGQWGSPGAYSPPGQPPGYYPPPASPYGLPPPPP